MEGPISMKLGGNKMILRENGTWTLESSDLDAATFEIEKLVEEKEALSTSLVKCLDQIEDLRKEVVEVNTMKSVVLEMLMNERQKRIQSESEAAGYKEELMESFRVIVELRKLIPKEE